MTPIEIYNLKEDWQRAKNSDEIWNDFCDWCSNELIERWDDKIPLLYKAYEAGVSSTYYEIYT